MKPPIRILLPAIVFVVAVGLTYLGITRWPNTQLQRAKAEDTIDGIQGLGEGEVISLPELTSLRGERVALGNVATDKLLLVFFTPACEGCARDAGLWRSLNEEAAKRSTAFYLIDVGHDRDGLDKFIAAYDLASLPILVSEGRSIGPLLKVNIVPQYLLVAKSGKVLHRWDGVRRYEQTPGPEELAKFFE